MYSVMADGGKFKPFFTLKRMNLLSSWEGEGGIFFGIIYKYNEK
jgi:hypothetical protein